MSHWLPCGRNFFNKKIKTIKTWQLKTANLNRPIHPPVGASTCTVVSSHEFILLCGMKLWALTSVKLWFTKMLFVGFYFVPNLIVIISNLLYPVLNVGFDCKGCVIERERESVCEDSSYWRLKRFLRVSRDLASYKIMHVSYTWLEYEKSVQVETAVSREYLAGKAFLWDTHETFYSTKLYYLIHTFYTHTIYTHVTHKW